MITANMYKSTLSSQGRNLSELRKKQSDQNINLSFTSSPEYKRVYILTKDGWKWEDAKFFRHVKQSISADAADSYLQFRPSKHYPIGSYVIIPDDTSFDINLNSQELKNPFLQDVDNRTQWWILIDRNDTNYPVYNVLRCNWNFKWIYEEKVCECFGCIRNANSYTSGIWTSDMSVGLDSITSMWLPDLHWTYGDNIKDLGLDDNRVITHGMRFFITTNSIVPDLYMVSKVQTAVPKGIIKITLKEDEYNEKRDNINLMIADYYNDAGQSNVTLDSESSVIEDNTKSSKIYSMVITSLGILEVDHSTDISIPEVIKIGTTYYYNVVFSDEGVEPLWKVELISDISDRDKDASYYESLIKLTEFDESTLSLKAGKASSLIGLQFKLLVSDSNGDYKSYAVLEVE